MRAEVVRNHSGDRQVFVGPEAEVRQDLLGAFPWLREKFGSYPPIEVLIVALERSQAFSARLTRSPLAKATRQEAGPDGADVERMMGGDRRRDELLAAAGFLASREADPWLYRRGLASGNTPQQAALLAVGLDPARYEAALGALLHAGDPLVKAEDDPDLQPVKFREVRAVTPDGEPFAAEVRRAAEAESVHRVRLGGKHSTGTMVSYDPELHDRLLLKPGGGGESPAKGADEAGTSQAAREAAFCAAMRVLGLQEYVPECHLLLLDERPYAALRMLGVAWRTLDEESRGDLGKAERALAPLRHDGTLHRLAAADLILGNTDRHANNVMIRGMDLRLIDHGSALAGKDFSPATDPDTFTPAYLRVGSKDFEKLPPDRKLAALPRLSPEPAAALGEWLRSIDGAQLATALRTYGVDPEPELARLRSLIGACRGMSPDLATNAAWVLP